MTLNLGLALMASFIVSLISFVGALSLLLQEKKLKELLILLVAFSAGGLIGAAFLNILPEVLEESRDFQSIFTGVMLGFILFFILERYLHWHHCHKGQCEVHVFSYLNLIGDGVHNLIDGLIIGASFSLDIKVGWVTTFAVILHEIPQELGDFGVLLYGGMRKGKALFYNFLSAATAILGTVFGYYFSHHVDGFAVSLLPFAAGGFIYIAACDLIPEIHRQPDQQKASLSLLVFLLGIGLMSLLKILQPH
jgi:zinc and cadmium transporter